MAADNVSDSRKTNKRHRPLDYRVPVSTKTTHTHTVQCTYIYIVQTPASIPFFLFSTLSILVLYIRLLSQASFVSFALFLYFFFLFHHIYQNTQSLELFEFHVFCSVFTSNAAVFSPVYLPTSLVFLSHSISRSISISRYIYISFTLSHPLSVYHSRGRTHAAACLPVTNENFLTCSTQRISKTNSSRSESEIKTQQFDNNDYFITPCAYCVCMW